jgi:hypothetical protein
MLYSVPGGRAHVSYNSSQPTGATRKAEDVIRLRDRESDSVLPPESSSQG